MGQPEVAAPPALPATPTPEVPDLEVLLWRATVAVETATDATPLATGFWVTPTKILTCAHVVAAAHGGALQVRAQDRVLPVASQDTKPPKGPEDDYPFPDLALLTVEQPPTHPCVLLDPQVRATDPLYAASFTDARPQGEPMTGDCEGRSPEPQPWIKFRLTWVRPGASGSAVLNLRTGGICGVLKRSRDTGDDKGGWASPADAIAAHWPTLLTENAAHHDADPTWRHAVQARLGTQTSTQSPTTKASAQTHVSRTLRITRTDVVLEGGPQPARHTPAGLAHADGQRLWDLERARRRGLSQLPERLLEVGATLARAYLTGPAGEALEQAVTQAEDRGQVLRLGLSISPDLAELPGRHCAFRQDRPSPCTAASSCTERPTTRFTRANPTATTTHLPSFRPLSASWRSSPAPTPTTSGASCSTPRRSSPGSSTQSSPPATRGGPLCAS